MYAKHVLYVISTGKIKDETVVKEIMSGALAVIVNDIYEEEGVSQKIRDIMLYYRQLDLGGAGASLGKAFATVSPIHLRAFMASML